MHTLVLWMQFVRIWADMNFGFHAAVLQVWDPTWLMSSTHEEVTHLSARTCLPWAADPGLMLGELGSLILNSAHLANLTKGHSCSPQYHSQISGFIHHNNWAAMLAGSSLLNHSNRWWPPWQRLTGIRMESGLLPDLSSQTLCCLTCWLLGFTLCNQWPGLNLVLLSLCPGKRD